MDTVTLGSKLLVGTNLAHKQNESHLENLAMVREENKSEFLAQ